MSRITANLVTDKSITMSGSSQQLLPANPNRSFLLIANPDASGTIYVNLAGGTAGAGLAGCVAIANTQEIQFTNFVPTNAITVQGTAASVVTCIEG